MTENAPRSAETVMHPSGLPVAVMTIRESIYQHHGKDRCYAWRQTGPDSMGVLAYDVCGLGRGHFGRHQAGWSGTGAFFDVPRSDEVQA